MQLVGTASAFAPMLAVLGVMAILSRRRRAAEAAAFAASPPPPVAEAP